MTRYPLLIKQLLCTPQANSPEQQIVYRDFSRYSYCTLSMRDATGALSCQSAGR